MRCLVFFFLPNVRNGPALPYAQACNDRYPIPAVRMRFFFVLFFFFFTIVLPPQFTLYLCLPLLARPPAFAHPLARYVLSSLDVVNKK